MAVTGTPTEGNDILTSDGAADSINALGGNDVLIGNGGNDTLNGGAGADTMIGGLGDDSYIVDNVGDVVNENDGEGTDTVNTSISYAISTGIDNLVSRGTSDLTLTGNGLANSITGNAGANVIYGGDDTGVGAATVDVLTGGQGNDTYIIREGDDDTIVELADDPVGGTVGGNDTVIVVASATRTAYTLTGAAVVENIIASDAASTLGLNLTGNATTQTIVGNAGVNILTSGGGADTLIGLGGNDIYNISSAATITETAGNGFDTVNITGAGFANNTATTAAARAARDYVISGDVEVISAATSAGAAGTFLNITGGTIAQSITGSNANNTLNGGGGADTLVGLAGDDTYIVDSIDDVVTEGAAGGADFVLTSSSFALSLDETVASNVETLAAAGLNLGNLVGQGNGTYNLNLLNTTATSNYFVGDNLTSQSIWGDAGANILNGRLTAAAGGVADTLVGLGGSDTYRVYGQTDVVVEDTDGGSFDFIYTSDDYNLATNDTAAAAFINPFGGGTSFIAGASQIEVLSAADQSSNEGGAGIDLTGNAYGQIIIGDFGDNIITDGGSLIGTTQYQDQLAGLRGNDTYNVTAQNTTVNEDAGNGTDTVNVAFTAAGGTFGLIAAAEVEFVNNTSAPGIGMNLIGNGYNQVITGGSGADNLNGGGGQDTLVGGSGADAYVVDASNAANVTIIEAASVGVPTDLDRVNTSVSFDLKATNANYVASAGAAAGGGGGVIGIEQIVGFGGGDINLTGNGARQLIVGTTGNNILDGDNDTRAGGANTPLTGTVGGDTMQGLTGNDIYRVYSQADVALERSGEGTDVVFTSGNYTLYAGQAIESLSAANQSSTTGLVLNGNEYAQTGGIIGTNGADTIWGLGGNDVLTGRGGSDIFGFDAVGAATADIITDFTPGDFIGLSDAAFSVGGSLDASEFVVGTTAADADDRIIYNQSTGQLYYDADGNGTASTAVLFAQITPGTALGFNDFVVLPNAGATAVPVPPTFTTATYG